MDPRGKHHGSHGQWIPVIRLIGGGLILCAALLYVWQHVAVGSLAREAKMLAQQKQHLESEHDRLASEIAYLSRSERITDIASSKIGLVFPESFAVTLYAIPSSQQDGKPDTERTFVAWKHWLSRSSKLIHREAEASMR